VGGKKFGGLWLLGAAYCFLVMAAVDLAFRFWPSLAASQTFFYAAVLGALLGGIVIAMIFKPKP
jgi:hypothetical protein